MLMSDNEKRDETTPCANDWEVVTLTASTYSAALGPVQVEFNKNDETNTVKEDETEASKAMLMSGHFAYPPKEPENLQLEPENPEVSSINKTKDIIFDGDKSEKKEDNNNWNEIQYFNDNDTGLSFDEAKFNEETTFEGLNVIQEELSFYHCELTVPNEGTVGHGQAEPAEALAEGGLDSDTSKMPISVKKDEKSGTGYPNEAWWKKQAASLYAQAKEANAFWSIFVAAAVMGLVTIGHHWQLERWQVLQLKWQVNVKNEKMGWMLTPLARLKDVIVGGNKGGFLTRSSSLADN